MSKKKDLKKGLFVSKTHINEGTYGQYKQKKWTETENVWLSWLKERTKEWERILVYMS